MSVPQKSPNFVKDKTYQIQPYTQNSLNTGTGNQLGTQNNRLDQQFSTGGYLKLQGHFTMS